MIIHDVIQGTPAWRQLRLGIPTASSFDRIITSTGKPSAQAEGYLLELLAEMVTGLPTQTVTTEHMQRGTEMEPVAISYYELQTDSETVPVGFMTNDEKTIGMSPDRMVKPNRLVEAKCPSLPVHLGYLLGKSGVDSAYKVQLQGQLYVSGFEIVDIVCWNPQVPSVIIPVPRDEPFIKLLDAELQKFIVRLAAMREELDQRGLLYKPEPSRDYSRDFLSDQDVEDIFAERKSEDRVTA